MGDNGWVALFQQYIRKITTLPDELQSVASGTWPRAYGFRCFGGQVVLPRVQKGVFRPAL